MVPTSGTFCSLKGLGTNVRSGAGLEPDDPEESDEDK